MHYICDKNKQITDACLPGIFFEYTISVFFYQVKIQDILIVFFHQWYYEWFLLFYYMEFLIIFVAVKNPVSHCFII